jgi:hypothetical protein
VWKWLVETEMDAYGATQLLAGPSALDAGPGWCFARYGQTATSLPDGREVLTAGEHEDSYDPDFFIYNDVVVRSPNGGIAIYGYPKEVFPPTDFHTATLLPRRIVLIGSLGYREHRLNQRNTQVLQLNLDNFSIQTIDSQGSSPGWIHRHEAILSEDGQSITISGGMVETGSAQSNLIENIDDWVLDLRNWTWTRGTERNWQQCAFRRADGKHNQLFMLRQAIWLREMKWNEDLSKEMQRLEASIGKRPDLQLIPSLYLPDGSVTPLPQEEDQYNIYRVLVDGVVVRFIEQDYIIRVMVEGRLPESRLRALQVSVLAKLSALENTAWEIA